MKNSCNYSDEWQPYIGDYDKQEYDIKLHDGTIVENCYPNGGKFNSLSDEHDRQSFDESLVIEIRFSQSPRFGINDGVSKVDQYDWFEKQQIEGEQLREKLDPPRYIEFNRSPHFPLWRNSPPPAKSNKIGRNKLCSCGSGKKSKKCCL